MNKLPIAKRVQILSTLVEGSSMRSIFRVVDVSINTVAKLLSQAGDACAAFHDGKVRNARAKRVQCDEIWSFCYSKQRNVETAKAAPDTWAARSVSASVHRACRTSAVFWKEPPTVPRDGAAAGS